MTPQPMYVSARPFQEEQSVAAAKVEIYTKWGCGFCVRAKALLEAKGAAFDEYDVTMGGPKKAEMLERVPGAATVPQILIGGTAVGGCDELYALDRAGKLDALLAG
jgi:glutaredoxin 3